MLRNPLKHYEPLCNATKRYATRRNATRCDETLRAPPPKILGGIHPWCRCVFKKHSGTTNLINHMKGSHSEFWRKINGANDQPKLSKCLDTPTAWKRGSYNAVKYDKYLAIFVIKNQLSLLIVKESF